MDLKKGNAKFYLTGKAKVNEYTFKLDEQSKHSDYIYSQLNLGVDCGRDGLIFARTMGGYFQNGKSVCYVHGKKLNDDKREVDDWNNRWEIAFEDRLNDELLTEVGDSCFINVEIEKQDGKLISKKFLSEYDVIEYLSKHLKDDMVINVGGNLKYQQYNDNIQVNKEIEFIKLVETKEENFKAVFTQTLLVDKDGLGDFNRDNLTYDLQAFVVDYVGKVDINNDGNKVKIGKNCLFPISYELKVKDEESGKKLASKLFKPSKSTQVYEVTVEGRISKGVNEIQGSFDDLPDDIKELFEVGAFGDMTEEEVLGKCIADKSKSRESFIITNPKINKNGDNGIAIAINKDLYTVDDYVFYNTLIENAGGKTIDEAEYADSEDVEDLDLDALLEDID